MDAGSAVAAGLVISTGPAESPEARLERTYDHCAAGLYRFFAVRTGDPHLADDLMQQLWLHARRAGQSVRGESPEAWLRAIAANLVRTHWREQSRRGVAAIADPVLAAELAERLVERDLAAGELERREVRDQLLLAISELPAGEQELIVRHYFEDASHATLAAEAGVSERAIEGRLYRARQALRERLAHVRG